ncbi:VanW family protein [Neobacillus sp. K501]
MILAWILGTLLLGYQAPASDSLTITLEGQPVATVNRLDYTVGNTGIPLINSNKLNHLLEDLNKLVSIPPKDAALDIHENIIPERIGSTLNRRAFTAQFYDYFLGHNMKQIEIPVLSVYPRVDSEILSEIRSKRIGRYITSYNPRNSRRVKNIQLATEAINNTVVFPGESFSFNRIVGKRTAAKGYLKAKVIVRGEYAEDIGGGICQVSSTLFNAVDSAGLKIVQRFSHSRHVPYIPPGRDATVSWYGPDFVFRNSYHHPVLIRAKTIGNLVVILVYSSEEMEYSPRKVPFPPL